MEFFALLILFIIIYCLPKLNQNIKFGTIAVIMAIMTVIRSGIGADYYSYYAMFNRVEASSFIQTLALSLRVEPGFRLWMFLLKAVGFSAEFFLAITSLIILIFFLKWIYDNSDDKVLSLILFYSLFFTVWVMSALRQGLVISIGSYLFLSKKERKFSHEIIFVVLLASLHSSAFIYLPIVILNHLNVSKKHLRLMVLGSLIISFIPFYLFIDKLSFIPGFTKLISNVDQGLPFLNFSYQVRLLMTIFGLSMYYISERSIYINKLIKTFIIGFSVYFLVSFSELIGSRIGIYSYISIVILIPYFIANIKKIEIPYLNRLRPIFISFLAICFAFLSLYKELGAVRVQSVYEGPEKIMPFTTIFNSNASDFGSREAFVIWRLEEEEIIKKAFFKDFNFEKSAEFDKTQGNKIVYSDENEKYYLINEKGQIVYNEKIVDGSNLYSDVIVSDWQMPLLRDIRYFDVTGENRTKEEMMETVIREVEKEMLFSESTEKLTELKYNDLPEQTQDLLKFKTRLQDIDVYQIEKPFTYYIVAAEYQQMKYYLYLDQDLQPYVPFVFIGKQPIDSNGILSVRYQTLDFHFNSEGELIWVK